MVIAVARKITIEFLGDDSKLQNTTDSAGRSTSSLGDKLKKVGKIAAIGLAAGVAVAGKALWEMGQAAVDDEAAQVRLAKTLQNAAGATDSQVAAVEKWISAQGRALGVTDDELRPALEKLVTATGDVGEAQKLASLAMNVSAGTGKSLEQVSTALMKAQNGQVAGLSRLGVETKNAAGETLTFEQVTKKMADTFEGQAAAKAETLQGKMARLKLILSEAGEEIGAKLIPVVTQLADWFGAKVMPIIEAFGAYLGEVLPGVFERIREVITGVFSGETSSKVSEALALIQEIILGYVELITAIWQKWGDEIVAVISFAWNLISGIVKAALEVVSGIIKVVTGIIKGDWSMVWDGIKQILSGAWDAIKLILKAALDVVKALLSAGWDALKDLTGKAWEGIKRLPGLALDGIVAVIKIALTGYRELFSAGWDKLKELTSAAWDKLKETVRNKLEDVVGFVSKLPSRITKALGDLSQLLVDVGKDIMEGLWEGLKDIWGDISDWFGDITSKIPDLKGPAQRDRGLLRPAGRMIMKGLVDGLNDGTPALEKTLAKVTEKVQKHLDKLKAVLQKRDDFAAGFRNFTSSVFGQDFTDPESGEPVANPVEAMLKYQEEQRKKAERLAASVKKLTDMGLSDDLIKQLQAQGESGIANINALAENASKEEIEKLNRENRLTNDALDKAGLIAANEIYGEQLKELRDQTQDGKKQLAAIERLADALENAKINIHLEGKTIQTSLLTLKRLHGGAPLGLA